MSAIPPRLISWLREHYPSPQVDPEWLDACYNWVITEHELDPATHMASIIQNVEAQLLQSDLCDSMCHGTGIPLSLLTAVSGTLRGPVLVEIVAITEVGASALALDQVRVVRDERLAAGEIEGDDEVDLEVDGEGAVPNYPRSMLRFELSDGASKVSAFEYRPLPELNLGVTPLGYKLILKNVLMRRGMAFLEPSCVKFKGQKTEDREVQQSTDFARGLRHRLGNLEPQPEVSQAPAPQEMRSPLREISQPPSPPAAGLHNHSDDEEQPRRRRVPGPPPSVSSSSTIVTSPYFPSSGSVAGAVPAASPRMGLALSPTRSAPIEIDISDDEDSRNLPLGTSGVDARPTVELRSKNKGLSQPPPMEDAASSDYGEMDMIDAETIQVLDHIERNSQSAPREVITIDDDEEMDDKENVPAPQRHVRRRLFENVIDISDD